jgi:hypothetical protein
MMPTPENPAASNARRIAPTRPSIMSLGATRSTPACACNKAICAKIATVRSLSTSVPAAFRMPSWPCVV